MSTDRPPERDHEPTAPDPEEAPAGLPHREVRDPRELRALTHPVRLGLLEQLLVHGPATATELAERLQDQSPANCSWHLRQLARYGYVEEGGSGPGRQRRWRLVPASQTIGESDDAPELARATDEFDQLLLDRAVATRRAWQSSRHGEPKRWRDATFTASSWAWLTADEMAEFREQLNALVERMLFPTLERIDPAKRPPGCRPAQLVAWLVPAGEETRPDRATAETAPDDGESP